MRVGATSLWELIPTFKNANSYDVSVGAVNSLNHHFWGDIAAWYITYIAGIRINEDLQDIYHVDVAPNFVSQLQHAEASHTMPYGTVASSWQRLGEDKILMFVNLPEGAHGELIAPRGWRCSDCTLSGGKKIILTRE